jgi:hypothetical protein
MISPDSSPEPIGALDAAIKSTNFPQEQTLEKALGRGAFHTFEGDGTVFAQ